MTFDKAKQFTAKLMRANLIKSYEDVTEHGQKGTFYVLTSDGITMNKSMMELRQFL